MKIKLIKRNILNDSQVSTFFPNNDPIVGISQIHPISNLSLIQLIISYSFSLKQKSLLITNFSTNKQNLITL
jgi:hypothetical protein